MVAFVCEIDFLNFIFAIASGKFVQKSVKKLRNSAKNLYKKRTNVVDSEISSIKSKNSMTELIPRTDDDYANTTNVKLHLRNNENQSNRLQQLSANRLQSIYMNGQSMPYYHPTQVIPIVMPFPYQTFDTNRTNDGEN